ncbi:This is an intracellular thiol proteinase inhibitor [Pristimantis euphronides]
MPIVGGLGCAKPATEAVQALCEQVKAEVEEKHKKKYPQFEAVEFKTQLVSGTNYFVKIRVGDEEYIHVCLYKTLPHAGDKLSLTATQTQKTKEEEIVHFQ